MEITQCCSQGLRVIRDDDHVDEDRDDDRDDDHGGWGEETHLSSSWGLRVLH